MRLDNIFQKTNYERVSIRPESRLLNLLERSPMKRAQNVLNALVSWARAESIFNLSSPENLIQLTNHPWKVSVEAAPSFFFYEGRQRSRINLKWILAPFLIGLDTT